VKHRFPAIYFEVTRLCNLSCPICMTSSNDEERVRKSRGRELSFQEIRDLVLVPAKRLGTVAVGWSGGEFLLRQDALDLLRLTAQLGYRCNVCSNCKLLDRSLLEEMKEAAGGKLTISVGINSIDEGNQWTRDTEADHSLEVLEICRELAIDRHDLKESFHPALRRSVNGYVSYTPFFLAPELYEQVSGARVEGRVPQNPPIGCWAGTWLTINAEGDVSVCPVLLDELNGGNVREKPLDELVLQSKLFADITDRSKLKGRCGRCRYQYTCGGCRAMAYFHSGDYMGEDPTCFFDPADRTEVSEEEAETNRLFMKYLIVARHAGFYKRPS
jgi:radical SAM protein with 4Fe4S-binding SPASM domain